MLSTSYKQDIHKYFQLHIKLYLIQHNKSIDNYVVCGFHYVVWWILLCCMWISLCCMKKMEVKKVPKNEKILEILNLNS